MTWRIKEVVEQQMLEDDETTATQLHQMLFEQDILYSVVELVLDGPSRAVRTASSSGMRTK